MEYMDWWALRQAAFKVAVPKGNGAYALCHCCGIIGMQAIDPASEYSSAGYPFNNYNLFVHWEIPDSIPMREIEGLKSFPISNPAGIPCILYWKEG